MPLRARITSPAFAAAQSFSSSQMQSDDIATKELPGDEPRDVLFGAINGLRTITLNRPKKLNSLNGSMARKILPRLLEWRKSQMVSVVLIKGEGRAFCAGGDVTALALANKEGKEGQQSSKNYFALEYKLDHVIATYSIPYVASMDGITMGGGVGLSVHAPFRIATENTVFAMPETTIGFFPDVGGSFFLPRLDGGLGLYLALTSEQLKAADVFWSGIATHYIHSSSLPDVEARLAELQFGDHTKKAERLRIINDTLEEFCTGLPQEQSPAHGVVGGDIRKTIDYIFQLDHDIDTILEGLQSYVDAQEVPQAIKDWAAKTKKTILQRSPTSVKVTIQQLREGRRWNIAETFRKEHVIASHFMEHADFVEGVSALLINKPKTTPNWNPSSLDGVSSKDVASFFKPEPSLQLLDDGEMQVVRYNQYPHRWTGLPRDQDIWQVLKEGNQNKDKLVERFVKDYKGKQGVKEKVEEACERLG
ncbi:3-hydroxyisobutyryl-CoA hydrolase mitochondrial precursor [Piedraia hortae CBS 480.64]|uniref:3-hydroxyisobutyryl-CoA hydrolase n=1 Tax=Piedraia hortae CBS 480.64 TaxID=1314780 RepID=A0A6A7C7L1_9PEZI|nr:3-hydroxyisobutyryl-CoA hydrolase mitochondrial precursor [Piedraia hortae CBS 480.64]